MSTRPCSRTFVWAKRHASRSARDRTPRLPGQVCRLGQQSDRVTEELEVDVAFTPPLASLRLGEQADVLIIGMILQQSLLMGGIAYVVGYTLLFLSKDTFPRRIVLIPFDLQVLMVLVVVICTLASLVGIRKALQVDPAEALGG